MAWMTVNEASKALEMTRRSVDRKVQSGELGSYLEGGRRLVWVAPSSEERHRAERERWASIMGEQAAALEQLRGEVAELRQVVSTWTSVSKGMDRDVQGLRQERPKASTRLSKGMDKRVQIGPRPAGSPDFEGLISRIKESWPGTKKELSNALGFHDTWIFEAMRGKLRSKRSWKRWRELEAFLNDLEEKAGQVAA